MSLVAAGQPPGNDTISAQFGRLAAELGMILCRSENGQTALVNADGMRVPTWREGYPYSRRMARKDYDPAKRLLQIELLKLQRHVKETGGRLLILFEGRDAAGKGGTIRRFTQNLNPRGTRVVALDKPSEHEQGDNYLRRYLPHLPGAGEIVMFDRSWYNRAGVERVMGFCPPDEYERFLAEAPGFERELVAEGIAVVKLWFSISRAEQLTRFLRRLEDPVKRWKLSPIDLASLDKWNEYTEAKEAMLRRTDVPEAPWTIIKSNDKKRARLEAMRHVLSLFDYAEKDTLAAGTVDPLITGPARLMPELAAGPAEAALDPLPESQIAGLGNELAATASTPRARRGRGAASADPAHLVERDAGGDPGVERLGARDGNAHERVALLRDQPGESLAL